MAVSILDNVNEKSTKVIPVSFQDEDEAAVTPNSISWTLTNETGTIINSRENVSVTPASTINIVLSGDDLAIGDNGMSRRLLVYALYDSAYGSDLSLRAVAKFDINNLVAVT